MIQVRELTKVHGDTVAVDRLTFDVTPGVVTGFLGPNGSGKSTTLRLIVGLDRPTSGRATIGGRALRDLAAPMHEVGVLLDARAAPAGLRARQHLAWLARAGGVPARRVDEVLAEVGLADLGRRRVGGFSLGMLQRLGIAAALLGDPAVLILDEPVNGLDLDGVRWVRGLLRRCAAEGRTVVVSSHLLSEMDQTADEVLVLGRGRLLAHGSVTEITRAGAGTHIRVASPRAPELAAALRAAGASVTPAPDADGALLVTGMTAPAIGDLAVGRGFALHELTERRATLEDAFIELTDDTVEYQAVDRRVVNHQGTGHREVGRRGEKP
ncbi:ABC transporter ATP-binding protein [Frankia sp. ACN1ag]|uniref:ABC transporter ATP-binding protein n=1 Tax=Frankia sp. ACN1ag TaxID=102891 RepID=UPI0006DC2670|nr:ATP-binding cassette domain-containing protein [Frankia sp. ACN1ag]KQC39850.1 ABC transporter ATP-binding protein [Frankia sp. ACN1ag]